MPLLPTQAHRRYRPTKPWLRRPNVLERRKHTRCYLKGAVCRHIAADGTTALFDRRISARENTFLPSATVRFDLDQRFSDQLGSRKPPRLAPSLEANRRGRNPAAIFFDGRHPRLEDVAVRTPDGDLRPSQIKANNTMP